MMFHKAADLGKFITGSTGQVVKHTDNMTAVGHKLTDEVHTDKTATACDEPPG